MRISILRRVLIVLSSALLLPTAAMAEDGAVTRYDLQIDWEAHATERLTALADAIDAALGVEPAIAHTGLSEGDRIANDFYVEVRVTNPADFDAARARLEMLREVAETDASLFAFDIDIVQHEDGVFRLAFARNGAEAELAALAETAAEIITARLIDLGIKPLIALEADGVIVVTIEYEPRAALTAMVAQRGIVSFRLVETTIDLEDPPPLLPGAIVFTDALDDQLGYVVGPSLLGGEHIEEAIAGTDRNTGSEVVGFRLDAVGAARFGEITGANLGAQFAIAIDNFVLTAPIIQEAISGGEVIIHGDFDPAEGRVIAALLGNGALPAPLILLGESAATE